MADAATLATTAEMQIPLPILRECDVSFTYPDSMISHYSCSEKGLNKSVIAGIVGDDKEKLQEKTSDDEHEDSL